MGCISRENTFSVGLDAAAVAFEDATAALKVLFGLLSLAEEEGAELILLQPLLALLIATAVSDDADTVICLPGEARTK